LPTDEHKARQEILQEENYIIQDNLLWHLGIHKNKLLHSLIPRQLQLCVPPAQRLNILQSFHDFSHAGVVRTLLSVRSKYFWPKMTVDIEEYCRSCDVCVTIKSRPLPRYGITSMPLHNLNEAVQIDHYCMASVKTSIHPYKYILLMVDMFSQDVFLAPTKTTSAAETAQVLYDRWVTTSGYPRILYSDRHRSLLSELVTSLTKLSLHGGTHRHDSPH